MEHEVSASGNSVYVGSQCARAGCTAAVTSEIDLDEALFGSGLKSKLGGGRKIVATLKQAGGLFGVDVGEGVPLQADLNRICDECLKELEEIDD